MPNLSSWSEYYEHTKNHPPSPLLIQAVNYVVSKNKAIDIGGGGTLKDSRYLLSLGFDVTTIDQEPVILEAVEQLGADKLHAVVTKYDEFNFPANEYDLAAAMFSLPFNPPATFTEVFQRIKDSLVSGGIYCGQFFGDRDGWASNLNLTFHTKEQVAGLLKDLEVILLEEKEYDATLANGAPKHWHIFNVIARKKQ